MATEYARTRLQFGRPIGSFQASKHKCADMLVEVEFARSAAHHAAFRAADRDEEPRLFECPLRFRQPHDCLAFHAVDLDVAPLVPNPLLPEQPDNPPPAPPARAPPSAHLHARPAPAAP